MTNMTPPYKVGEILKDGTTVLSVSWVPPSWNSMTDSPEEGRWETTVSKAETCPVGQEKIEQAVKACDWSQARLLLAGKLAPWLVEGIFSSEEKEILVKTLVDGLEKLRPNFMAEQREKLATNASVDARLNAERKQKELDEAPMRAKIEEIESRPESWTTQEIEVRAEEGYLAGVCTKEIAQVMTASAKAEIAEIKKSFKK